VLGAKISFLSYLPSAPHVHFPSRESTQDDVNNLLMEEAQAETDSKITTKKFDVTSGEDRTPDLLRFTKGEFCKADIMTTRLRSLADFGNF
jgi:hypothetical protein